MGAERKLGITPPSELPFRPNPEDDAERAERIRQARLAQLGCGSGAFFQLTSRTADLPGGAGDIGSVADIARAAGEDARSPVGIARGDAVSDPLDLDLQTDQNL